MIFSLSDMSLVVAKKDGNNIFIVSDTKLTNPDNLNKVELSAPEEFGAIKTIILNPFISIAFAGNITDVKKAIAHCRKLGFRIGEILDHLLTINKNTKGETEFIVCINLPPFLIYEIKNSKYQLTSSAWIGDIDGFNEFQKAFLSANKNDLLAKVEDAMTSVIESNVKAVNGFLITVTNEAQQFSYKQYIKTYMPSRTYSGIGLHVIDIYGTVYEGGYTISLFANNSNDVLAVHLRQNRYGLIYPIKNDGYLQPEVYKDVDEHEFNEITELNYRLTPPLIMSSRQQSYFERGNKSANKKDFIKAIEFYDLGLNINEKNLVAPLQFYKGICQFYLQKFHDANLSFQEAIKANRNFQPKVFQFINQFSKQKN